MKNVKAIALIAAVAGGLGLSAVGVSGGAERVGAASETFVWDTNKSGFTHEENMPETLSFESDGVPISIDFIDGSTPSRFWTDAVRIYKGSVTTLNALNGYCFDRVEFGGGSKTTWSDLTFTVTVGTGKIDTSINHVVEFEGDISSVSFEASATYYIPSITFTYSKHSDSGDTSSSSESSSSSEASSITSESSSSEESTSEDVSEVKDTLTVSSLKLPNGGYGNSTVTFDQSGTSYFNGVNKNGTRIQLNGESKTRGIYTMTSHGYVSKIKINDKDGSNVLKVLGSDQDSGFDLIGTTPIATYEENGNFEFVPTEPIKYFGFVSSGVVTVDSIEITWTSQFGSETESLIISGPEKVRVFTKTQFDVEFTPDDANDRDVIWESSSTEVATISQDGVLTAIDAGQTTVKAYLKNNASVYDELEVTVEPLVPTGEDAIFDKNSFGTYGTTDTTITISDSNLAVEYVYVYYNSKYDDISLGSRDGLISNISTHSAGSISAITFVPQDDSFKEPIVTIGDEEVGSVVYEGNYVYRPTNLDNDGYFLIAGNGEDSTYFKELIREKYQ